MYLRFIRNLSARFFRREMLLAVGLLASLETLATNLEVTVLDVDGQPVPDVVIYVESAASEERSKLAATAVMDQVDTRFVPHVLVVQSGTSVEFPNSDIIAHHVYSFSTPNQFVLPLYKGDLHPPVRFEHAGVVTVGCNIHDGMLGYILVVDSATFTKTGKDGKAVLSVDNSDGYSIRMWSPRLREGDLGQFQAVSPERTAALTFSLLEKLRDGHSAEQTAIAWQDY